LNPWPNFFLIGAGKSGTTSLYHYLGQHPQIFMSPVKEPKFFTLAAQELTFNGPGDQRIIAESITGESEYRNLFKDAGDALVRGEASTIYLSSEGTAEQMARRVPDAKMIAILRHPADRAYSAYMHLRRDGYETLDTFQDALDAEPERIRRGYYYHWRLRSRGYYGRFLKTYLDHFPPDQIKVFLYEDLQASAQDVLAGTFRFLGVDDSFRPDVAARHNQSGLPRSQSLQNFLTRPHPFKEWLKGIIPEKMGHRAISLLQPGLIQRPGLDPAIRSRLTEDFREDILMLEDLIKRDLSHWLSSN